jgi:hypothetical protein
MNGLNRLFNNDTCYFENESSDFERGSILLNAMLILPIDR